MKRFLKNITVFFVPVFIGIVLLFVIPVDKKFSYQFVKGECNNIASWIYHRTFESQKNIDIVFSGASHFACGIMDEMIENELNEGKTDNTSVVNFGYCRAGRDVQYIMLKDVFKRKNPKILVIEVTEDEPRKSHPVFPFLAETDDLFGSFVFFNQRFFNSLLNGVIVRFEYLKFRLLQNSYSIPENTSDFGYLHSEQLVGIDEIESNKRAWEKKLNSPKPDFLKKIERNYSKHYIEKIAKLAQQNDCQLIFFYLPESGSGLTSPINSEFYKTFGPVICLPDAVINNPANWKDPTHFNDKGAALASEFIIPILKSELSKIQTKQ